MREPARSQLKKGKGKMREKFREKCFSRKSKILVDYSLEIVTDYMKQGIKLTLRQLYYQLVSKAIIPNSQKEYMRLSRLLTAARYAGIVDWNAIEDRVRHPEIPNQFSGIPHLIDTAIDAYKLDRWNNQKYYVEVFCEKDALSSVLAPIATKWHVTFSVNRGYASATVMYDTARRIQRALDNDKAPVIFYIGDHDPSGLDMVRDIGDRIAEFCGAYFQVVHLALTSDQVRQYGPPPNPAKMTDTRARDYIAEHGHRSWEVDALPPQVLNELLTNRILEFLDLTKYNKVLKQEEKDKNNLKLFAEHYNEEE